MGILKRIADKVKSFVLPPKKEKVVYLNAPITPPKKEKISLRQRLILPKSPFRRKNSMRNKGCFCGSSRKTKHCCWWKLPSLEKAVRV
jgi:hypothetical protein